MAPRPYVQPSQEELDRRKIVGINRETVTNITSTDFPGHYPGEDNSWNLEVFRNSFSVQFHQSHKYDACFSLIGIDASIANAFRRILLAEVATVAIEHVFVLDNTSIVQDEVLSHRLGLVPLTGSAQGFNWMRWYRTPEGGTPGDDAKDIDTLLFALEVECTRKEGASKDEDDPEKLYNNAHVYARDLVWLPQGRQEKMFSGPEGAVRPANPDILLAKLRPGQRIKLQMQAIKGIGQDHAKFSPVCPATYRLLPTIDILKPIIGYDAKNFAECFPKGVIGLEVITEDDAANDSALEGHVGEKKAVVKNTFKDTVSRECLRHEEFQGKVRLGRQRDHFIFSVESTGQFESDALFLESVKVLRAKCSVLKKDLENIMR